MCGLLNPKAVKVESSRPSADVVSVAGRSVNKAIEMKKFLMLLVLAAIGCVELSAQNYYIPRYRRERVEKDYTLSHDDRKLTFTLGASYDLNFGLENSVRIKGEQAVNYGEKPELMGVTAYIGIGYKVGKHFVAGLESGYSLSNSENTLPLYGAFKWYYGNSVTKNRHRWFNYLNVGPKFYFNSKYKKTGAAAGIGGGLRLLVAESLRMDVYMGYHLTMIQPKPSTAGTHDIPASRVNYKQWMHGMQIGLNIMLF